MSTSVTNVPYLDHTAKLGGGELALLGLTAHLNSNPYRPIVVLASDGPLVEMLRAAGVETHVLALSATIVDTRKGGLGLASLLKLGQIFDLIGYSFKLSRLAKKFNVGIIHTNSLKSDIYGVLTGLAARKPVVWHVRDHITSDYLPGAVAKAFKLLAATLPTAIVANSESTLSKLGLNRRKRSVVAYSGVDDDVLARKPIRSFNGDCPVITLVGRIAEWKGQHVFIDAASQVIASFPNARFQIVGSPLFGEIKYEESLHSMVESRSLERNVAFLGFRSDVVELIEQSDIVVHTSCIGEPFGQVVVQGMAAGKPVIATDGGALPEIVVPGVTGLLTKMGDSDELANAIMSLLRDPESAVRMGLAGRERVGQMFKITQTVAAVTGLYDSILGCSASDNCRSAVLSGN